MALYYLNLYLAAPAVSTYRSSTGGGGASTYRSSGNKSYSSGRIRTRSSGYDGSSYIYTSSYVSSDGYSGGHHHSGGGHHGGGGDNLVLLNNISYHKISQKYFIIKKRL